MARKGSRSTNKAKPDAVTKAPLSPTKEPTVSTAPPPPPSPPCNPPSEEAEHISNPLEQAQQEVIQTDATSEDGAATAENKPLFRFQPMDIEDDEDGEFSPDVYGHMHRMILQGFLSAGFLDVKGVKKLFSDACKAANKKIEYDVLTSTPIIQRTVRQINAQIEPFDMVIKSASCEITGARFYAYLLTYRAQVLQFQTCFSKAELAYFHTVVDVIIRTNEFKLTFRECISIRHYVDENYTKKQAEEFMGRMIALQYFTRAARNSEQDNGGDFEITLGFRTIRELEVTFRENYDKVFTDCRLCRIILMNGVQCPGCSMTLHRSCLKKYLKKSKACGECGTDWANTELRARRRHEKPPSSTSGTQAEEEDTLDDMPEFKPKNVQRQSLFMVKGGNGNAGDNNNGSKNKRKADVPPVLVEPLKGIVPFLGPPISLTVGSAQVTMDKQGPGSSGSSPPSKSPEKPKGNGAAGCASSRGNEGDAKSGKKGQPKKGRGSPPKGRKSQGRRASVAADFKLSEPSTANQCGNNPTGPPTNPGPNNPKPTPPARPKKGKAHRKSLPGDSLLAASLATGSMDAEMAEPVAGPSREITGTGPMHPVFEKPPPATFGEAALSERRSLSQSDMRESDEEFCEAEAEGVQPEEERREEVVEEYDSDFFETDMSNKDVDMDTADDDTDKAFDEKRDEEGDTKDDETAGSELEDVEIAGDDEEDDDITARFEEHVTISGGKGKGNSAPSGDDDPEEQFEAGETVAGPREGSDSPPDSAEALDCPDADDSGEEDEYGDADEEFEEVADEQQEDGGDGNDAGEEDNDEDEGGDEDEENNDADEEDANNEDDEEEEEIDEEDNDDEGGEKEKPWKKA